MPLPGETAAETGVRALVATQLSLGDPALLSDAGWRKALGDSARHGDFHDQMILGTELMQILAGRR